MKPVRHTRIKEIIERYPIQTQEELSDALREIGIEVTQATISRDIKDLMLIKIPTGDGGYRYAFPKEQNQAFSQVRMRRTFQDNVESIDSSLNVIVLKTLPGNAQAVAYIVDSAKWPEIIGTVAGDDTIFIVVKPPEAVEEVVERFRSLLI